MIVYTQSTKFPGFDATRVTTNTAKMSSFAESTGAAYLKSMAIDFVDYNKRQLSRIYPKGTRVDSSNFLPQVRNHDFRSTYTVLTTKPIGAH